MDNEEFITETHSLWAIDNSLLTPIERQIEEVLSGYLCYPDFEWPKFGVVPPDNHDLVGSWRTSEGDVFVFLLKVYRDKRVTNSNYLIIIVGTSLQVKKINNLIYSHKGNLIKIEKKELKRKDLDASLTNESKRKSIENFSKIIGIFTVIVNAFSLYLRKLPPPSNMNPATQLAYESLVTVLHFSSLFLLLLVVLVSIMYTARYGYMMLRRMK